MKFKGNYEGECPFCESDNLDYGEVEFSEHYCYFPWKCEDCGHEGKEYYDMEFVGHNVFNDEGNEIEIKYNMIEKEY
jgi:hypothetical protein